MIVAITGPVGSGKSTVARIFREFGAKVISADRLGHELLRREDVKRRIKQRYGEEVFNKNGSINRSRLAKRVFENKKTVKEYDRIIHPLLRKEIKKRLRGKKGLTVIDAALFYELGLNKVADVTVLVKTGRKVIEERIKDKELLKRMEYRKKIKEYDFCIDNSRDIEHTKKQVFMIIKEMRKGT